jgi:hypothetical protein
MSTIDGNCRYWMSAIPISVYAASTPSREGRPMPIGVVVDAEGRVVDLNAAHDTPVRHLREFTEDSNVLEVAFWAYSPICALTRDHSEFERIYTTLTEAAGTAKLLWVATHSTEVVEGEADEDGCIPAYPKIMDVRPV